MDFTTQNKVVTLKKLQVLVLAFKAQGKTVVTTNGCFDLVHAGHVENLEWARGQGGENGVLIVGVNSDASVGQIKPGRSIVPADQRMRVLAGLDAVNYVFCFDGSPLDWIPLLAPDIHIKGEGADVEKPEPFRVEREAVERVGGEVRLAPKVEGLSTTNIVERIQALDRNQ